VLVMVVGAFEAPAHGEREREQRTSWSDARGSGRRTNNRERRTALRLPRVSEWISTVRRRESFPCAAWAGSEIPSATSKNHHIVLLLLLLLLLWSRASPTQLESLSLTCDLLVFISRLKLIHEW